MKTKIIAALFSLTIGLGVLNAGNNPSENIACLKVYIPKLLEEQLSGWDMTALENKSVSADVSFTIDVNGNVNIVGIKSEDEVFVGIIKKNMRDLHIDVCAPADEETFHIRLKYVRQ